MESRELTKEEAEEMEALATPVLGTGSMGAPFTATELTQDEFEEVAYVIANKSSGFVSFNIGDRLLDKIIYEVSMCDLEQPPKNKLRKVIFKPTTLSKEEKLRVVGELIGRSKRITQDDIYNCMLDLHDAGKKIVITQLALWLECSTRTIHRNMGEELKREKELLNQQL